MTVNTTVNTNLLKREHAPILPAAWQEIDEEARGVLSLKLGGRKVVDFSGPHGFEYAAVNLGRLDLFDQAEDDQALDKVHAGRRQVQPLAEIRIPIHLSLMELDSVGRGGRDPELEPVVEAASQAALFEDRAIFYGHERLGISGIVPQSPHSPLTLPTDADAYPHTVVAASEVLRHAGVEGPYALVLGDEAYGRLTQEADDGYPLRERLEAIIEGPIVWSPAVDGGVLLSQRGEDWELTVGQDFALGYVHHDRDQVELFLTESFTFRTLGPEAAVALVPHGSKSGSPKKKRKKNG